MKTKYIILIIILCLLALGLQMFSNYYFPKCSENHANDICNYQGESLVGVSIGDDLTISFQCKGFNLDADYGGSDQNKECKIWGYLWIRKNL